MINLIIVGPRGNMGKLIVKIAAENPEIKIIGGVGSPRSEYIGKDIGEVAEIGKKIGANVYESIEEIIDEGSVIIDFSTVETSLEILKYAKKYNTPLVCGTTGFSENDEILFNEAAKSIPVLKAANTSYVVNVMEKAISIAADLLKDLAQIEIIEMHSFNKLDSPSGTSKELAKIIKEKNGNENDIKIHSVRAGNIPSSHSVLFGCMGERLEITHHAYNWECYAIGACMGAEFLNNKAPGMYYMEDVINDRRGEKWEN